MIEKIEEYVDSAGDWHLDDDDKPCLQSLIRCADAITDLKESGVWPLLVFLALKSNEDRIAKMCTTGRTKIHHDTSRCSSCDYTGTEELEESIGNADKWIKDHFKGVCLDSVRDGEPGKCRIAR